MPETKPKEVKEIEHANFEVMVDGFGFFDHGTMTYHNQGDVIRVPKHHGLKFPQFMRPSDKPVGKAQPKKKER